MPPGDVGEGVGERSRDGACRRAEPVVRAAVVQVLREDDQPRAAGGRLRGKGRGAIDVGIDVVCRVELHEGDRQAHCRIVAATDRRP